MGLLYHPNHIFQNFVVIGAGGTGSRIVSQLCQLVPTVPWIKRLSPNIFVYDDDIVEEKNIARQLFTRKDVGQNKAVVVARRYSAAYEVPVAAITNRIEHESDIIKRMKRYFIQEGFTEDQAIHKIMRPTIYFMAVDSMAARRNIIAAISQNFFPYASVIIDPGNEDTFGQVRVFNPFFHPVHHRYLGYADKHMEWVDAIPDMSPENFNMTFMPIPLAHYLTAQDGKGTGSCADLDQTLALNSTMASACISVAQNLMYCQPLASDIAYFSLNLDNSSHKLSLKWLKGICRAENPDYISQELMTALKIKGNMTWEDFVEKLQFTECAYDALKDHVGIDLTPDQVNFLKNIIPYPCINLEQFDAQYAARLAEQQEAIRRATAAAQQPVTATDEEEDEETEDAEDAY